MKKRTIVTIGRQFGSGGREIGQLLAKRLGIKCYDNELITASAKESGLCEDIFKTHDEKPTNSFLYSLVTDSYLGYGAGFGLNNMPLGQQVFLAQFDTIRKIAKQEDAIFVGRCADYALRDDFDFVTFEMMMKMDKKRSSYYNYYTDKQWGNSSSYDLCINSGKIGIENAVDLIIDYLKMNDN